MSQKINWRAVGWPVTTEGRVLRSLPVHWQTAAKQRKHINIDVGSSQKLTWDDGGCLLSLCESFIRWVKLNRKFISLACGSVGQWLSGLISWSYSLSTSTENGGFFRRLCTSSDSLPSPSFITRLRRPFGYSEGQRFRLSCISKSIVWSTGRPQVCS